MKRPQTVRLTSTIDHGETVTYVWESVHEMTGYLEFLDGRSV